MLLALAAGEPADDAVTALAEAVLASAPEAVRLAIEVRAGGTFARRRGIELAALVLEGARPASREGAGDS